MHRIAIVILSTLAATAVSGCATLEREAQANAALVARSGSQVAGSVDFYAAPDGLKVVARLSGLPAGEHGFHIHEVGDCSAPDAASAKGHFNPGATAHGHYQSDPHHAGDMPNIVAAANGAASATFDLPGATLSGANGIVGRAVVIHADPDDYRSQPAGNSGQRIACGVIVAR